MTQDDKYEHIHEVKWPEPREDPPEERSHPGARLADEPWWRRFRRRLMSWLS